MAQLTQQPTTLFDKIWDAHRVTTQGDQDLLLIDRHLVHEGSFHAFDKLRASNRVVRCPGKTVGIADHYVPTNHAARPDSPEIEHMIRLLEQNTGDHGITLFGLGSPQQGIVHVVAPEQGITLPGLVIVCGDSHTATHGALGAFAFGIGASEVAHVLATQTLWQKRPGKMRITVSGALSSVVTAKDLALHIIGRIGTGGATGHVVEYAGQAIHDLSVEGRMTLCNMTIEAGARAGLVAPDQVTIDWLKGRPYAPEGESWNAAVEYWRGLETDQGAVFDREVSIDASAVAPMVTWGTSPEEVVPIDACVPDDAGSCADSLEYMGLKAGDRLDGLMVDRVFIGSCTNSRIEDLRAVASILRGRRVAVETWIVPGSTQVKHQAHAEGLDSVFVEAGALWLDSGCSMCVGINGDRVPAGQRCASTTNRNFRGRQGPGARTHLMSPAMAAAAAVSGHLCDVRQMTRRWQ